MYQPKSVRKTMTSVLTERSYTLTEISKLTGHKVSRDMVLTSYSTRFIMLILIEKC